MKTYFLQSAEALRMFGAECSRWMRPGIFALFGELGAGKTTFVQGALSELGAKGPFTSPTFVLMKRYDLPVSKNGIERVYHVDAYRINEDDLRSQGFLEWVNDPAGIVLLEWPERVSKLLPKKTFQFFFSVHEEGRKVRCDEGDARGDAFGGCIDQKE